jgi:hypothetical protein
MAIQANAIIRVESVSTSLNSRIVNASERGLLLSLPEPRPVGTRINITLHIDDPSLDINVSGIIVHVNTIEAADPLVAARAGIFLTDTSPDWLALCRRLARLVTPDP